MKSILSSFSAILVVFTPLQGLWSLEPRVQNHLLFLKITGTPGQEQYNNSESHGIRPTCGKAVRAGCISQQENTMLCISIVYQVDKCVNLSFSTAMVVVELSQKATGII